MINPNPNPNPNPNSKSDDRLSSLPDSILHYIVSFLPQSDASNTRILSKSWLRFWIHSPNLSFSFPTTTDSDSDQLTDSNSDQLRILESHFFASIRKCLSLRSPELNNSSSSDSSLNSFRVHAPSLVVESESLKLWILYASSHRIQHLDLNLRSCVTSCYQLRLPASFFDTIFRRSPSLQTLKLCIGISLLKLPSDFFEYNLRNLRVLHLKKCQVSSQSVALLLSPSASPALEDLTLNNCHCLRGDNLLHISSPNLTRLHLMLISCTIECNDFTKLCVNCPKLELFHLTFEYPLQHFEGDMPSLVKAIISVPRYFWFRDELLHVRYFGQLLSTLQNVVELTVNSGSTQWLSDYCPTDTNGNLPIFHALRSLDVDACFHYKSSECLVYLLQHMPNLNFLRVSLMKSCTCLNLSSWRFTKLPPGFLDELKEVIIDDSVLEQHVKFKDRKFKDCLDVWCSSMLVRGFVKCLSINVKTWERVKKTYCKYLKCEE